LPVLLREKFAPTVLSEGLEHVLSEPLRTSSETC